VTAHENVRLTPQAEEDVVKIWLFIARDNVTAADRTVDHFTKIFRLLADNPEMGTQQDRYRLGLRAYSVGRYFIFYHCEKEQILVFRVLHGARNLDGLL
jgi:toxin ParE1/3/4